MQITHEQARKLIQRNADEALNPHAKLLLSAHLEECSECSAYDQEIHEVESILSPMMKRQWNLQPIPLSMSVIAAKKNPHATPTKILTMRTAMITIVLTAFIFNLWQFAASGKQIMNQLPAGISAVPTPSIQSTSTKLTFENCEMMLYTVQRNDTLASIANQFAVSKEQIMSINKMTTETVITSKQLMIPDCNFTPTSTVNAAALTTTYTPTLSSLVSTPDG